MSISTDYLLHHIVVIQRGIIIFSNTPPHLLCYPWFLPPNTISREMVKLPISRITLNSFYMLSHEMEDSQSMAMLLLKITFISIN